MSGHDGSVRGVGHVPAERFEFGAEGVGAGEVTGGSGGRACLDEGGDLGRRRVRGCRLGRIPDTVEIETVNDRDAGEASTFPAASTARTVKVWLPFASAV